MKFELVLPRSVYLIGEKIGVDVELTNTGDAPVDAPHLASPDNPQPEYLLRGPSYPDGVLFNFRDSRANAASSSVPEPTTFRLFPGATMEAGFELNSIKPIATPGDYTIRARIDAGAWSAEAAPAEFRLEKAKFIDSSLGVDIFSRSAPMLRAVWLADGAGGRILGESFLYEKRPDLGEVKVTGSHIIRSIGPTAFNAFCPWVNFDRTAAGKFWHGWQEGTALFAFSEDEAQPRVFDLGSKKAQVVRPTIMNRSGDLDVLVLGADRRTLRMIRFPAQPTKGQAAVALTIELPQKSVAIGLGFGSEAEGGSRAVAAVSQTGSQMAIRLIRIGDTSATVGPPVTIDQAFALPGSEPSVSIASDGTVQTSMVFARHSLDRELAVSDVTSHRSGEANIVIASVGTLQEPVSQAWTAQSVTLEGRPARRWLARSANSLSGGGDHPIPVRTDFPVFDFLRMSAATYVLVLDPDRGPFLLATDF